MNRDFMSVREDGLVRFAGTDIGPRPFLHAYVRSGSSHYAVVKVGHHKRWGGRGMARINEPTSFYLVTIARYLGDEGAWSRFETMGLASFPLHSDPAAVARKLRGHNVDAEVG